VIINKGEKVLQYSWSLLQTICWTVYP